MATFGEALTGLSAAIRKNVEMYRDLRLDGLRFQRIIPPLPAGRANGQWASAFFGVPDGWENIPEGELALESTRRGCPFYAGIWRLSSHAAIAAGEFALSPGEDPQTAMAQMFFGNGMKEWISRSNGGLAVRSDTLVLVGFERGRAFWLAPDESGTSVFQIWGVRNNSRFYVICEGPAAIEHEWGPAAVTVAGTWVWRE